MECKTTNVSQSSNWQQSVSTKIEPLGTSSLSESNESNIMMNQIKSPTNFNRKVVRRLRSSLETIKSVESFERDLMKLDGFKNETQPLQIDTVQLMIDYLENFKQSSTKMYEELTQKILHLEDENHNLRKKLTEARNAYAELFSL